MDSENALEAARSGCAWDDFETVALRSGRATARGRLMATGCVQSSGYERTEMIYALDSDRSRLLGQF